MQHNLILFAIIEIQKVHLFGVFDDLIIQQLLFGKGKYVFCFFHFNLNENFDATNVKIE